jgi:hypothetical protein
VLHSGVQGIGKSILTEAVARIYGTNASVIGEAQLCENFNWWQKDKQFVIGEEIQGGRDKKATIERLELLITSQGQRKVQTAIFNPQRRELHLPVQQPRPVLHRRPRSPVLGVGNSSGPEKARRVLQRFP